MIARLLQRTLSAAITLVVVIGLCLALLRSVPGGPLDQERLAPPEVQAALAERYGLDLAFHQQLYRYLNALMHGDLGPSFQQADFSVNELLQSALPLSLQMGGLALLLAGLMALSSASLAMRDTSVLSPMLTTLATLLQATPKFVLGPLLILWLALAWRWFPVTGYGTGMLGLVLPILTLALPQWAWLHRVCLAELINTQDSTAWRAERARGAGALALWRQLAWPLLLPRLSIAVLPASIALLSGSAVVEQIFSIPGMGRLLIQGALNRDYTVVLGVVSVTAALVLLLGLLSDLCARWLDPRLRSR
jgi:oligopeptide transport system permease protein